MKTRLLVVALIVGLCLPAPARAGNRTLRWIAVPQPDLDYYTVTYGEDGQAAAQTVRVYGTEVVLTLPDGKYYQFSVTATNTLGVTSLPSAVLVFQTGGTGGIVAPSAPTGLKRGDITLTLQSSPDQNVWSDIGYAVVQPAAGQTSGFYRINPTLTP